MITDQTQQNPVSKPARVAFVTHSMQMGGLETFVLHLGQYLDRAGFDVTVITTTEPGEWYGRISQSGLRAEHVTGYNATYPLMPLMHSLRVGRKLLRGKYDILFLNHARHAQASIGMLPDRVVVIPILHNDFENVYRVGCANECVWNVAVGVSPRVTAVSRSRLPNRPVVHIPYGVSMPAEPLTEDARTQDGRMDLAFVGRLEHKQKGVLFLPDILKGCLEQSMDAKLAIAGEGSDKARLQQKFYEYGLQGEVDFCGPLPPDQVYELLQHSHALLMPSFHEGLPIVLLETMACGCVPVASRLKGITDTAVEDGQSGFLVEIGDVQGFVDAVHRLSADRSRWLQMSKTAQLRIARDFSVDAMGRTYIQLIEDSLGGCCPSPCSRRHRFPLSFEPFARREWLPDWMWHIVGCLHS